MIVAVSIGAALAVIAVSLWLRRAIVALNRDTSELLLRATEIRHGIEDLDRLTSTLAQLEKRLKRVEDEVM